MSNGNWGNRIALGVAYLALLVIVFGASYGLIINGYAELHKAYATYQATADSEREATAEKIESACLEPDRAKFLKCFRDEIKTYYEQQATNQDLQAQQDMAFWAGTLFILGIGQAALSAIGIFFIWRSLALNRDAVSAAVDSNKIARKVGEAQVRAYLTCVGGHYRISDHHLVVFAAIKNNGQSPAHEIKIASELCFRTTATNDNLPENTIRVFNAHRLPPKDGGRESIASQTDENVLIGVFRAPETGIPEFALLYQGNDFELDCRVSWLDVFDVKQVITVNLTVGTREIDNRPQVPRYKGTMAVHSVRHEKVETETA